MSKYTNPKLYFSHFVYNDFQIHYLYFMKLENRAIVFYDGDCGFCNWIVAFIFKAEKDERIYFSALQSSFAHQFLSSLNIQSLDYSTFYFYDGYKIFKKSTGALQLLRFLKWPYRLLYVFWLMPVSMRDYFYDLVARRRHRIMNGNCMLPTAQQRRRLIDSSFNS